MHYIAIDIGSSYIKSIAIEMATGCVSREHRVPTPGRNHNSNPRAFEIDAEEIFKVVLHMISSFCEDLGDVEGLLFSTQMHGCVISDTSYGNDTYISWQDTRCLDLMPGNSFSYMEHLRMLFPSNTMQNTGVEIKPALALCNLYTLLMTHQLKISEKTEIFTLGSYLIFKLTGNNICHITNAAPMGFVNLLQKEWRYDILDKAGLGGVKLPKITADFSLCGTTFIHNCELKVYPDFGDQQISVLGCGASVSDIVANIATAAQVIQVTTEFVPGQYEVRPYFENLYCNVISRMPAGRNLDVFIEFIREIGESIFDCSLEKEVLWKRVQNHFSLADPEGLEVDISTYELPDKLADGAIRHINHFNLTLRNLLSAILRDIGRLYAHYIQKLIGPMKFHGKLIFSGGTAFGIPALIKAIEKETGLHAESMKEQNEVYTGMIRAALMCAGHCESLQQTEERVSML